MWPKKIRFTIMILSFVFLITLLGNELTENIISADTVELNLNSVGTGAIMEPGEGKFSYPSNSTVKIKLEPTTEENFIEWLGDSKNIIEQENGFKINLDSNKNLTAVFESDNTGFYTKQNQLFDANDNEFIIRGLSFPYTWFTHQLDTALPGIKQSGANTVRVVLSSGDHQTNWGRDSAFEVENIIEKFKEIDIIPVLEVHDATGYGDDEAAAHISDIVDYWLEIKDVLIGQEDYVIINIANEPFGNQTKNDLKEDWINEHQKAIQKLRAGGLKHTLMIDAPNWGQDWQNIMLENADKVYQADPYKNIIFSVHMYEVYGNQLTVENYFNQFPNDYPLVVGEFGPEHYGDNVAHEAIMESADKKDIGYIGWSWKGNSPEEIEVLDMVHDWAGNDLTPWGETLFKGDYGLQNTAETCSIFKE